MGRPLKRGIFVESDVELNLALAAFTVGGPSVYDIRDGSIWDAGATEYELSDQLTWERFGVNTFLFSSDAERLYYISTDNVIELVGGIEKGATGPTGPAGADGIDGTNGTNGVDGEDGEVGPPINILGELNDISEIDPSTVYEHGDAYVVVPDLYFYNKDAVWVNAGRWTGPTGPTGSIGPSGATGDTGPTGPAGLTSSVFTRPSTTSVAIGTGSKTFNYASVTNIGWSVGQRIRAFNSSANYMEGVITTVSTTSVTILVDYVKGSGTLAAWTISITGDVGTPGDRITAINTVTASRTLALGDAGAYLRYDDAVGITLTVPTNASVAFSLGTVVSIRQAGLGQILIVGAAGVAINGPSSTINQHHTIQIAKIGTDTWDVIGGSV